MPHSHPKSGAKALHWMKTTTIFSNRNETPVSLQGERLSRAATRQGLSALIASGDIAGGYEARV